MRDKRINGNDGTCWPHFPGVIVDVENAIGQASIAWHYEARIYGKVGYFVSYDEAVEWCKTEKRIAAWHEEQLRARSAGTYLRAPLPLADEFAG